MRRKPTFLNDMAIVINSSGRHDRVLTVKQFPRILMENVQIAVPSEQASNYAQENKGWKIRIIPEKVLPYLSSQRQWVMDNVEDKYRFILFMDDDLRFFKRDKDLKLHKCGEAEIIEAFDLVYRHAASFKIPMVGISTQLGNNRVADDYDEICRVTRCYCVDRKVFKEAGASFAPYEPFCMQDFHVSLTLLEKGYPNRVLYTFAQDDVGSNAAGGCSRYRTFEVLERAAKYLTKVHPGHATFRVKKTKGAWEGMGKQDADGNTFRVDITVRWKEAYKPKERSKQKGFSDFFKEENNGSSKQS